MKSQNEIQRIATEVASQLVATAAKTATNLANVSNPDHDLLQRLDQKVDVLKQDIAELKNGTSTTISDHENRLRNLEQRTYIFGGGLAILTFLAPYIIGMFK